MGFARGVMLTSTHLLRRRRFLPLFVTQLFNAFNDNLYKTTMVLFVVYAVYNDESTEAAFSGLASGLFILPFFLLSALAGQLADMRDKARIIRTVKLCEIALMTIGAAGLYMAWQGILVQSVAIPLLLLALFLTGVQSTFLGPIKYAILPQHLKQDEVLAGTGLVEAGTYIAILAGTILAGPLAVEHTGWAAIGIIVIACIGYLVSRQVPAAPPMGEVEKLDWHILRASVKLVRDTMHNAEVYYAILAISFFWTIGAVLFIQFPPRYSPVSVIVMGAFVVAFYVVAKLWEADQPQSLLGVGAFLAWPMATVLLGCLLGIAIAGGMFVVPLYAFLTTRVAPHKASRTIAANNIVNSGAMVAGSLVAMAMSAIGIPITEQVLLCAAMCLVSAWLGKRLVAAENEAADLAAAMRI